MGSAWFRSLTSMINGLVTAVYGERVEVRISGRDPVVAFRSRSAGVIVVGDRVMLEQVKGEGKETGWRVAGVEPRQRCIWRSSKRRRSQLVVANVDRLCIVSAVEPLPREGLIDRYLVAAEWQSIPSVILLNKVDLEEADGVLGRLRVYTVLGYEVLPVSARNGTGVEEVAESLSEGLTVLVGHSGVGKSALMNCLLPGVDLKTAALSQATGKGRYTTSVATAHLFRHGILVDTPGIREFGLGDILPGQVSIGFREIRTRQERCRFADCSHREEPGCAVRVAVGEGGISEARYNSYLRIRESVEAGEG